MPVVKVIGQYEFRFHSRGERAEPAHIHVRRGRLEAKYWLVPQVRLARAGRFRSHELNEIARLIGEYRQEFLDAWQEHFG
jgi:hypothetical protein